jgi:hypothetical protein
MKYKIEYRFIDKAGKVFDHQIIEPIPAKSSKNARTIFYSEMKKQAYIAELQILQVTQTT